MAMAYGYIVNPPTKMTTFWPFINILAKRYYQVHWNQRYKTLQLLCKMGFEKWVLQATSEGTILKSPLDSQASLNSEEIPFGVVHVIKAKSCRLGRSQKTVGDYSLLLVHLLMSMLTTLLL
ncbi:unnamed protein product [Brassica rapa]|uniref:Uncharacterized protein n=1 Tax=Brassica campestris TaxID=3711 RepID=A0A8D9H278_BRACM|nr:unnamed protein product [Brassica rapa]